VLTLVAQVRIHTGAGEALNNGIPMEGPEDARRPGPWAAYTIPLKPLTVPASEVRT
jgi:hypothetical protein